MSAPRAHGLAGVDPATVCADARAAREAMDASLETLRVIRRELVDASRLLDAASLDADHRAVSDRKRALLHAWRAAVAADASDEAVREATGTWLRAVSDTNRRTLAALRELTEGRRRVAMLEAKLRAADMEAAAVRIRAETAEAACEEARRLRAAAEEQEVGPEGRERVAAVAAHAGAGSGTGGAQAGSRDAAVRRGLDVGSGDDRELPRGPSAPPILPVDEEPTRRLLSGDPAIRQALANELAAMTGHGPSWHLQLLDRLVDELTAAALDAGELVFDPDHRLWAQFDQDEARLIIRGFRDLGFRLDVHEGWFGGRSPSASDLASALGFAGHDLRSMRGVPSAIELQELPTSVQVAVHDHLRRWAPDLTLDGMIRALGPRAAGLGDLWDEWGRVRPLLAGGLATRA